MKPFQIENAKTRFFESKEKYLEFKQAWKDFHNNEPLVEWKDKDITPYFSNKPKVYARTKYPVLSAEHYMLYNLLRGYDIAHGFSPLTNEGRLNANKGFNGHEPWYNTREAANRIVRCVRNIEDVNSPSEARREYCRRVVDHLMLPFGDTISLETLVELGGLLYEYLSDGQKLPTITVREYQVIEKLSVEEAAEQRLTLRQKIMPWRKS